jgi:hypothetical protein
VAVIRSPEIKTYTVMNFGHPGMAFGLVGGLIAASDQSVKSDQLSLELKNRRLSVPAELANGVAAELSHLGFRASVEDAPWEEKEGGKYTLPFEKIQSGADAVVVVTPTIVGFIATAGGDYLPTIAASVTILGKDRKNPLYRGFHDTGWQLKAEGWRYSPPAAAFPNFDDLMRSPARTADSLVAASSAIARSVALDLRRLVPSLAARPLQEAPARAQAPPPVPAPPQPPVASAAPAVNTAAAAPSWLPAPGSSYRYLWSDLKYGRKQQEFRVRVVTANGSNVGELWDSSSSMSIVVANELGFISRRAGGDATFIELSPYMPVAALEQAQAALQKTNFPSEGAIPYVITSSDADWDQAEVPAGSFRALRISVQGQRELPPAVGSQSQTIPKRFVYTVWYAPDVKRSVRLRYQVWSSTGLLISDEQVDLLEYKGQAVAR